MIRVELSLWLVTFAERIHQEVFDSFTVTGDHIHDALASAERELSRRKQGDMVITSVAYAGEASHWSGQTS